MDNLLIDKTVSTPMIRFDAAEGSLEIIGESYPENVSRFYIPVLDWLKEYLHGGSDGFVMKFDVPFFNSSTSKIFLMIFDLLEEAVRNGERVAVRWMCERENEMAVECGEEFKEDLEVLPFSIETYEEGAVH